MPRNTCLLLVLALAGTQAGPLRGQEPRFYEENGVTYQETVRTVRRPVLQTEWQQREQTVYRQQLRSEVRDTLRTYSTPVTQHEWITRMHGRWNPFITPYFTHHLVPVTRWEQRAEVVPVSVLEREWVPEKRIVSVPVTTHRVAEERVVSKTPVGPAQALAPSHHIVQRPVAASASAGGTVIGGTALDGDPPRQGLAWRPPDSVRR